jgi:hypothetical protein
MGLQGRLSHPALISMIHQRRWRKRVGPSSAQDDPLTRKWKKTAVRCGFWLLEDLQVG